MRDSENGWRHAPILSWGVLRDFGCELAAIGGKVESRVRKQGGEFVSLVALFVEEGEGVVGIGVVGLESNGSAQLLFGRTGLGEAGINETQVVVKFGVGGS